jgi:hypothetical protein
MKGKFQMFSGFLCSNLELELYVTPRKWGLGANKAYRSQHGVTFDRLRLPIRGYGERQK